MKFDATRDLKKKFNGMDVCSFCKLRADFTVKLSVRHYDRIYEALGVSVDDNHYDTICLSCISHRVKEYTDGSAADSLVICMFPDALKMHIDGYLRERKEFKNKLHWLPAEIQAHLCELRELDKNISAHLSNLNSSYAFWRGATGSEQELYVHLIIKMLEDPQEWLERSLLERHLKKAPPAIVAAEQFRVQRLSAVVELLEKIEVGADWL
jgi:hypothetical protein